MEIELQEIYQFLSQQVLFNELSDSALSSLVGKITIHYLRRGQNFPPKNIESSEFYLLRSGAIDLRNEEGELLQKLAEGDSYAIQCMPDQVMVSRGYASEDSLLYAIPCTSIQTLRNESSVFEQHFVTSVQQRMKLAISRLQRNNETLTTMQYRVSDLTQREPVVIDAGSSISDAAKCMTEENISSVLVMQNDQLVGLVSDRDLRRRCLAEGISRQRPISEIMTSSLITIPENTVLSDALLTMTRYHIHHLPIMRNKQPVGYLSVSDLIRYLGTNSAYIASDIEKANTVERLIQISQHLPELQLQLAKANTTALQIGEIISAITDSLTCRLLAMAEQQLGDPPVPYVWVAGGSQGRNEQTSHSDQDNALIISDKMQSEHEEYFQKLSSYVSDGLNACGYVYCPGDAMATNNKWRQPVSAWRHYFSQWIEEPAKKALMLSSIFFDLRPVYGDISLYTILQQEILAKTRANRIFIAYMVSNALAHTPPLGFFRNFVLIRDQLHDHTLDIKHRGIVSIVDIARIYALTEGVAATNTTARLHAAHENGSMSQEMSENLIDALEYISSLRIQHQAQQIRHGHKADNYLDPKSLSGLERGYLKDAFMIIKDMQEVLESRHQTARMV